MFIHTSTTRNTSLHCSSGRSRWPRTWLRHSLRASSSPAASTRRSHQTELHVHAEQQLCPWLDRHIAWLLRECVLAFGVSWHNCLAMDRCRELVRRHTLRPCMMMTACHMAAVCAGVVIQRTRNAGITTHCVGMAMADGGTSRLSKSAVYSIPHSRQWSPQYWLHGEQKAWRWLHRTCTCWTASHVHVYR